MEDPQTHWKTGKEDGYKESNAPYYKNTGWTKYLGSTTSQAKDPSATDEDALKTVLDPEDDAATVNWGSGWRMPTKEEMEELLVRCTWTKTEMNGIKGYKVQSLVDLHTEKWIFLPFAGRRRGTSIEVVGSTFFIWTSTVDSTIPERAYLLNGATLPPRINSLVSRATGCTIRPVHE